MSMDSEIFVSQSTLDTAEWSPERLARAYGSRPLNVSMMSADGTRDTTEHWPFARWVAMVGSLGSASTPYLRNLALPDSLQQPALKLSPFRAEHTACSLFAGASTASSELHRDGIRNALLVVHGTKLVVMLNNVGRSCAEVAALNAVITARAASGPLAAPGSSWRWPARPNRQHMTI